MKQFNRMDPEITVDQHLESREKKQSIEELTQETRRLADKLSSTHIQGSNGIIMNDVNSLCQSHCLSDSEIPIVCGKGDLCHNERRAVQAAKKIQIYEHDSNLRESLEEIY